MDITMTDDCNTGSEEKVKILFINPSMGLTRYRREDLLRSYLPLGTLASALMDVHFLKECAKKSEIHDLDMVEGLTDPPFEIVLLQLSLKGTMDVKTCLKLHLNGSRPNPNLICMTATSAQMREAEETARAAAQLAPEALRVIGGPHASVVPAATLRESDFQVACMREGVETLTELALASNMGMNGVPLNAIRGVAYKASEDDIIINQNREYAFKPDDYPFPSRSLGLFVQDLHDTEKNHSDIVYVLGGYGCQFDCIFCAQRAIHGGSVRERSAESVFNEIEELYRKGFKRFAIVQETFLGNRERIEKFCRLLDESSLDIAWTVESRVDQLEYPQLQMMKKAGLRFIQIGLESGDQDLLDKIGKGIRLDRARRMIKELSALQIDTAVYLLVGLPNQHWQSILRSALFFMKYTPYNTKTMHASTSITIPYLGTKIRDNDSVRIGATACTGAARWQTRNPEVSVNEKGEFVGENFTETDDMTSHEIFEAFIFLGDLCQLLLRIKYDDSLCSADRIKYREYMNKIYYMIERRTIRDLIVRAQKDLTAEKRLRAFQELISRDGGEEDHFKDVTEHAEESSESFRDFLVSVSFENGFDTMKCLSVSDRMRWMKICSFVWISNGRRFNRFIFYPDNEGAAMRLNDILRRIGTKCCRDFENMAVSNHESGSEWKKHFRFEGITFEVEGNKNIIFIR
jgi:anaerobic magnesium-protoporphyrin IX monomethyl ester cyclase